MSKKEFIWNNGTADSPVVVTSEQIKTLIKVGNSEVWETDVRGVIQPSTNIYAYLKYSLNKLHPNLTVLGGTVVDSFGVSLSVNTLKEGESTSLIFTGSSGMSGNDFQYKIVYVDSSLTTDGYLTAEDIKSRITCVNGVLSVAAPSENSSWSIPVKVQCFPLYQDMDTSSNYVETSVVLCQAVAVTSVSLTSSKSTIDGGDSITVTSVVSPSNMTKASIISENLELVSGNGSLIGNTYISEDKKGDAVFKVTITLPPSTMFLSTATVKVNYTQSSVISLYNTGMGGSLGNNVPSSSMVTGDYVMAKNSPNIYSNGYVDNFIYDIRKNSHLYAGIYNNAAGGLYIKQISDTDKTLYADGSKISEYWAGSSLKNAFLKLPTFYYKLTMESDTIKITFSSKSHGDKKFMKWDTDTLIGVYPAGMLGSLRSIPSTDKNLWQTLSISGQTMKQAMTAALSTLVSKNFSLLTLQAQQVMLFLYLGYYGGTSSMPNDVLSDSPMSNLSERTGTMDSYGMTDALLVDGTSVSSTNFWGLEDWFSSYSKECIGDVTLNNYYAESSSLGNINFHYRSNISESMQLVKLDVKDTNYYTADDYQVLWPLGSSSYTLDSNTFYGNIDLWELPGLNSSAAGLYTTQNPYVSSGISTEDAGTVLLSCTSRLMYSGSTIDVSDWTSAQFDSLTT